MAIAGINFNGPITHPATTKLRNVLCGGINERLQDGKRKFDKLCLFMNSPGGSLDDGIGLFGFLRSLPIEVTTINVGIVASIAIAPFLAGTKRIALPHARFHFHDFEYNYAAAHNLTRLEYLDHTQILNSARDVVFDLLKKNTSLTDGDLKKLKLLEIPAIKDAAFAKEKGIVHEVDFFPVTEEMNIFNVDY
ncbi:MAG TPA: ATP-dependent Clp protease proteolytic subunit [Candidatus Dormibacteraeota bacterium]|jgi:ATP-dependent protease ClpP protease subunit|nr:ATP-dependent Clp protease proteolytic subunit [Candidatus Dormibacteraeota bacterium]